MDILRAFAFPIALLAIFYFLLIRPQQKKDKKVREMRSNLQVGDHIVTIGGIVGIIR
ncbi:MAG: preprotein translocase subunit YajC, partial [Senegalia sp. (in: firmicutes)]